MAVLKLLHPLSGLSGVSDARRPIRKVVYCKQLVRIQSQGKVGLVLIHGLISIRQLISSQQDTCVELLVPLTLLLLTQSSIPGSDH